MAKRAGSAGRGPDRASADERPAVLRRRISACVLARRVADALMIAAGLLGIVVFPWFFSSPTALSVWVVRGLAVGSFLVIAGAMFLDQRYRGELLSQEKGRDVRDEVLRSSLYVVAAGAVPNLLIVSF